jgi:hypothetical protein
MVTTWITSLKFKYGDGSFMGLVEDIENYFSQEDTHHPAEEACDCGGTVMTPEHDFREAQSGY